MWERGARGERQIAAVLAELPNDCVVFHDLQLPASKANVDHLVVAPHGVYVIDTKNFSHPVTRGRGRGADRLWTGRQPIRLETCKWEASTTASLIGVEVQAMLCIIAPSLPDPLFDFDGVTICEPKRLVRHITAGASQTIDVSALAVRVSAAFGAQPEVRIPTPPSRPSPRPVRKLRSPDRPQKRRVRRQPWLGPILTMAALILVLVFLPTIMSVIGKISAAASERLVSGLTSVPATSSPTTTELITEPAPVVIEASCPNPGNGWVISFGWPGDLPGAASAYSIRWQTDDGQWIRHDVGGWSDPSEELASLLLPLDTPLRVTTDLLDGEGRILTSTRQQLDKADAC